MTDHLTNDLSQFVVLEQCHCMSDAPQDYYPDYKGYCQYCVIKSLLIANSQEIEALKHDNERAHSANAELLALLKRHHHQAEIDKPYGRSQLYLDTVAVMLASQSNEVSDV